MATGSNTAPPIKPRLKRRAFISYARKDGTATAQRLSELLQKAGCEVWLDTTNIRGGASWSKEIEAALTACDVLVAVLTPASYTSEICRAEQISALDEGKPVIPVLAVAGTPLPFYLKSRNWRRFPEQQAELLSDIAAAPAAEAPTARPLRYDTVPNLPQNYLIREQPLAGLRDLVFTEGAGANIAVTAVAGMGGIGKTVLATALCRDLVVQRAFPDGIAWITIGREWDGDFVTRMREVARALGDDLTAYDNPLACENRYRTILREKAALVVVDDVWNLEHLQLLLVDAPRSRFLFTTRDAGIAKAVTGRKFSANLLSESEGRELLARWAGMAVTALPAEADQIIRACGELAAAVAQVGAGLRDVSLDEWRDTLQALERADISGIEDRLPSGQKSFFKSLAVSVEALPAPMQERYLKLAVLLGDVPAPLVVLQTLWKVNEAEGRRTARYFVDRSLATWETAEPARGIKLHDLQLDYVRARCDDPTALQLILGALRLSAHVVARRPEEFAAQMVGRLLPHQRTGTVAAFTRDLAEGALRPWLKPLWPSLHPPGTGLLRTLEGHSASGSDVAVTPDGLRAVSASVDNTLKVWDLESGHELRTLKGHSYGVSGVAVTPDGRRAVSASVDKTLKVWDLESGRELRTLKGHSAYVDGVAVTPDGRRAVSASGDKTLKVWDLESGCELRTLEGHSALVSGVAVAQDGRRAVSASYDKTLKVWDLESGRALRTLAGHSDSVTGVAVTPDGRRAVSASYDHTLRVWDLESGRELRTLEGHSNDVSGVAVTPDGRRAVSASWDNTLKVWDLESGRELRTLEGHSYGVSGVAVTPDGRRAVSASGDHTLKVWDLERGRELGTLKGHSAAVSGVAMTPDGRRAVSASGDKTLKVWDLESGSELRTLEGHSAAVSGVSVTPDGRRAVCASWDGTLKVWDLESGRDLRTLEGHSAALSGVSVTPDGRRAVSASEDNTLKVWDLESGRELRTLAGHSDYVHGVAVTPDGRRAVSASYDKTLKVWDLESGRDLRTLAGHSAGVSGVAVTADGRRAVSASRDKTLKVWDLESGRELRTLAGHSAPVLGVAVTPDGRRAVSASGDNTLKVWDLESGAVIAGFTCEGMARCCAFAGPDKILAGDSGGRLHLLRLEM
jgi:WD40 repeat protein